MKSERVTVVPAHPSDVPAFKKELQAAFAVAVVDAFGTLPDGPIPSDEELEATFTAPGAVVLRIVADGRKVGGAVVTLDAETHRNALDLFFIEVGEHGRGLGREAWLAIERRYPETVTWQTYTPYFEKRNIHFYVNKCGFGIVEFFNPHHPDPHRPAASEAFPGELEGFRFEKTMRSSG